MHSIIFPLETKSSSLAIGQCLHKVKPGRAFQMKGGVKEIMVRISFGYMGLKMQMSV